MMKMVIFFTKFPSEYVFEKQDEAVQSFISQKYKLPTKILYCVCPSSSPYLLFPLKLAQQ